MENQGRCGALFAVAASTFASLCVAGAIFSILTQMMRDFGFPEIQIGIKGGIVISAYYLGSIFNLVWGVLADLFGRRRILLFSLISVAASSVGIGAAGSYGVVVAFRFLEGVLSSTRMIGQVIIADISTPETKTFNMGIYFVSNQLGFSFGPLIAGSLAEVNVTVGPFANQPYLLSYLPLSALCLLAFTYVACFFRDTRDERTDHYDKQKIDRMKDDDEENEMHSLTRVYDYHPNTDAGCRSTFRRCYSFSRHSLLAITLFALAGATSKGITDAESLWGGLQAAHGGLGLSTSSLGVIFGVLNIPVIFGCLLVAPRMVAWLGERDTAIINAFFAAFFAFLLPFIKLTGLPPGGLVALMSLVAGLERPCFIMLWQMLAVMINDWSPEEDLGLANGASTAAFMVAATVAPLVVGTIVSANDAAVIDDVSIFHYGEVFVLLTACYCTVGIGLLFMPKKNRKETVNEDN